MQKLLRTLTFEFVPSFGLEAVLYQLRLVAQTYAENPSAVIHLKHFMSALRKTGEYSQLFQKDGHAVMRTGRRSYVQQCALEGHLCLVKIVTDAFQALWETEVQQNNSFAQHNSFAPHRVTFNQVIMHIAGKAQGSDCFSCYAAFL